jgi:hypothetical protein
MGGIVNRKGKSYTRTFVDESKAPVDISETASVPFGGSATVTINVPSGKRYHIKQVNITKLTNTTIDANGVLYDGVVSKQIASYDNETVFGAMVTADGSISVTGTNASIDTNEDLTLQVIGYSVEL